MAKKAVKKVAKKTAVKPVKRSVSALDVEKELVLAHQIHSRAGLQLVTMLATRKLSLTRVRSAALATRDAADHMDRLVEELEKLK